MILFGQGVKIKYFVFELLPMFVNAAMWSNRYGVDVEIQHIDDDTTDPAKPHGVGLAMKLDALSGTSEDRHGLFLYLSRCMPFGYYVEEFPDHVFMEWRMRGAEPWR